MALGSLGEVRSCEGNLLMVSLEGDGFREEHHETFCDEGFPFAPFVTIERLGAPGVELRFSS